MEVTKEGTVTDDGDGVLGVGDTVNYTIKDRESRKCRIYRSLH
jgi:hypothetical protein